jgi:hypothetical protein
MKAVYQPPAPVRRFGANFLGSDGIHADWHAKALERKIGGNEGAIED